MRKFGGVPRGHRHTARTHVNDRWSTAGGAVGTHIYVLTRVIPAARFPSVICAGRAPDRPLPREIPCATAPITIGPWPAQPCVLVGTGAGSAEDVPAAVKPTAPEWSL